MMLTRLLAILVLVLQPVVGLMWGPAIAAEAVASCHEPAPAGCCCAPERASTCAADASATVCLCRTDPVEPRDAPEAPRPRDGKDTVPLFCGAHPGSIIEPSRPFGRLARRAEPRLYGSHNETQALLCVWRT